jgi:hypothetical protein
MKVNKPKRYYKPQSRGCAWCKHAYLTPVYVECKKYPDFNVEYTGWCNEFEEEEPLPKEEVK